MGWPRDNKLIIMVKCLLTQRAIQSVSVFRNCPELGTPCSQGPPDFVHSAHPILLRRCSNE